MEDGFNNSYYASLEIKVRIKVKESYQEVENDESDDAGEDKGAFLKEEEVNDNKHNYLLLLQSRLGQQHRRQGRDGECLADKEQDEE